MSDFERIGTKAYASTESELVLGDGRSVGKRTLTEEARSLPPPAEAEDLAIRGRATDAPPQATESSTAFLPDASPL
jgi:hypothetical protein